MRRLEAFDESLWLDSVDISTGLRWSERNRWGRLDVSKHHEDARKRFGNHCQQDTTSNALDPFTTMIGEGELAEQRYNYAGSFDRSIDMNRLGEESKTATIEAKIDMSVCRSARFTLVWHGDDEYSRF
jgi:hypothetical protein